MAIFLEFAFALLVAECDIFWLTVCVIISACIIHKHILNLSLGLLYYYILLLCIIINLPG